MEAQNNIFNILGSWLRAFENFTSNLDVPKSIILD